MNRREITTIVPLVVAMVFVTIHLIGCDALSPGTAKQRPQELVLWGDPDPGNSATFSTVRDVNDVDYQYVVIGTDGTVQFSTTRVCDVCDVQGSTILVDDEERMHVRFGTGPDGTGDRRPFLVSTDGFYIELVQQDGAIAFQEEDVRFEEPDDPSDDLAQRVGTIPNPALES